MALITLTTDFGLDDWFVGTMKGVIRGLAPEAELIDITHGVARGDIRAGAFALAEAVPYFPPGTSGDGHLLLQISGTDLLSLSGSLTNYSQNC